MLFPRVPPDMRPNRLAQAVARARAAGRPLIDLTLTNPTRAGLDYPPELMQPLASPAALMYDPQPFGLIEARSAVARDYARRGVAVDADRIVLTTSTSEGYSILFKLLCAPEGNSVLVPVPSYPLFDHLTALDGVRTVSYPLEYHGCWSVDWAALDARWSDGVRAALVVSPNNPTGSIVSMEDLRMFDARCAAADVALIIDEVFADYSLSAKSPRTVTGTNGRQPSALTFRLGGLSKSCGLPQVKLGWIGVEGPDVQVRDAMENLELICDTYLSVSTPVQLGAPALLERGAAVRTQILKRVQQNYAELKHQLVHRPSVDVLQTDAGWSAVLRMPAVHSEEDLVLELLERDDVLVHPGFFFDFPHEGFVILSLLPLPGVFAEGVRRLLDRVDV